MSKVRFHFLTKSSLNDRQKLKAFLLHVASMEKREVEALTYVFCSDEYLLEINRSHLNHDYYTDIITFDLSDSGLINGEIYISIDRVKENARTYSAPVSQELLRVCFHGLLHLLGYKDKIPTDQALMRSKEDYYLDQYKTFHVKQKR